MTNVQIISEYIADLGIEFVYDGGNLCTFQEWKRNGMSVKKGETAFLKIPLWTMKLEDAKDENGAVIMENGKPKKEKVFYKKTSALFTADQVEKISDKPKRKKKSKKTFVNVSKAS